MYYCWHIFFSISVRFDLLMANSIQIIVINMQGEKFADRLARVRSPFPKNHDEHTSGRFVLSSPSLSA